MLVNINGGYKTLIALYLTNSLACEEKVILLKDLHVELCIDNIDVFSVTFDEDKSNEKSVILLGANFDYDTDNFKPYFSHPVTKELVYIFFDPCHMLKLVQNYFAKQPISSKSGKIDCNYLVKLKEKQYSGGLHCACKIKNKHVFFSQRMKVFLAAQVLSNSVAVSLRFICTILNDLHFVGSEATGDSCQNFNDMFDILNAKNLFCKIPGRTFVTEQKMPELKKRVDIFCDYIKNLEVDVKKTLKQKSVLGDKKPVIIETTVRQSVLKKLRLCVPVFSDSLSV